MDTPPPSDSPAPSVQAAGPGRQRMVLAVVVGLALGAVLIGLAKPPSVEKPVTWGPRPAAPPSDYPLCEELHRIFDRARVEHGCRVDAWAAFKDVCEKPFKSNPECQDELRAAVSCLGALPQGAWSCDDEGVVWADGKACPEMDPFIACLDRR